MNRLPLKLAVVVVAAFCLLASRTTSAFATSHLVKDITPGSASSNPSWLTALDSQVIFTANGLLYASDGTTVTQLSIVHLGSQLCPGAVFLPGGPTHLARVGTKVLFAGDTLVDGAP